MIHAALSNSSPTTSDRWLGLIPLSTGRVELTGRSSYQRARIRSSNFTISGGRLTLDANEADFVVASDNLTGENWGEIAQFGLYGSSSGGDPMFTDRLRSPSDGSPTTVSIGLGGTVDIPAGQFIEVAVRTTGGVGFSSAAAGRAINALFSGVTATIPNKWIALMTSPTAELNRASYRRALLTSSNYTVLNGRLTFDGGELDFVSSSGNVVTEDWGEITHWGIYSSESGGTLDYVDEIRNSSGVSSSVTVNTGGTVSLPSGQYLEFPSTHTES